MKNYGTQAVVCLDPDLTGAANAHAAKPGVLGEATEVLYKGEEVVRSAVYHLGARSILPEEYRLTNSRLIIVTHGTPCSKYVTLGGGQYWTPEQMADAVKCWLDSCYIKRIALKICYAGGRRGGVVRARREDMVDFLNRFTVHPRDSFAYRFARVCGFAQTITAQTSASTTVITGTTFKDFNARKLTGVHEEVDHVRKGHAYKIALTPVKGANTSAPSEPKMALLNPLL